MTAIKTTNKQKFWASTAWCNFRNLPLNLNHYYSIQFCWIWPPTLTQMVGIFLSESLFEYINIKKIDEIHIVEMTPFVSLGKYFVSLRSLLQFRKKQCRYIIVKFGFHLCSGSGNGKEKLIIPEIGIAW